MNHQNFTAAGNRGLAPQYIKASHVLPKPAIAYITSFWPREMPIIPKQLLSSFAWLGPESCDGLLQIAALFSWTGVFTKATISSRSLQSEIMGVTRMKWPGVLEYSAVVTNVFQHVYAVQSASALESRQQSGLVPATDDHFLRWSSHQGTECHCN